MRKIVSGGQTGADRAALDAAIASGFPTGGFCPKGRLAEDGPIDGRYSLEEIDGGYLERTIKNVEDSEATLIFYDGALTGGTLETRKACERFERPFELVDISSCSAADAERVGRRLLAETGARVLNVAGPRASGSKRIYGYVNRVVSALLREIASGAPGA